MISGPLARARKLLEAWQALHAAYAEAAEIAEMLAWFPVGRLSPDFEETLSFLTQDSALLAAAWKGNPEKALEEVAAALARALPDLRADALQVHVAFCMGTLAGLCAFLPERMKIGFDPKEQAFRLPKGAFSFRLLRPAPAMDLRSLTDRLLPGAKFQRFALVEGGWHALLERRGEWLRVDARLRLHAERPCWRPVITLTRLGLQGLDGGRLLW